MRIAGDERLIAADDAGLFRDALGVMPPGGLPEAYLDAVADALTVLLVRFARSRGPFTTAEAAARYALPEERVEEALAALERDDRLVRGELRPGGSEREWCDPEVLRRLRRASLAALRKEVEPAEQAALGRFLPAWHGIDRRASLHEALVPLQGLPLPVSLWEAEVLPRRVPGYQPAALDGLCASGEVVWVGAGLDRVALFFREDAPLLGAPGAAPPPEGDAAAALRAALARSAEFWPDLLQATGLEAEEALPVLWELVWAGEVTNDAWAPLRAERRYGTPVAPRRPRRFSRARGLSSTSTQGRWSPASRLFPAGRADRRALAELLLERQGIVVRDGVRGEGIPGGYGAVYGELRALETVGSCRRGYFVEGLGGAQFALPGAVERLRELRADTDAAGARARRRRPRTALRRGTARGRGGPAPALPACRARRSSSSAARRCCSSSEAAARSCPSATPTRNGCAPPSPPWSRTSSCAAASGSRSSASTVWPSPRATSCRCSSRQASWRGLAVPCCVRSASPG